MKENRDLDRGVITGIIRDYGVHGITLKKIITLVKESNVARDKEEFEMLILECCAAWCSMISFSRIHKQQVTVHQVVMQVIHQTLEERLLETTEIYDDGVYYEKESPNDVTLEYRNGYVVMQSKGRKR